MCVVLWHDSAVVRWICFGNSSGRPIVHFVKNDILTQLLVIHKGRRRIFMKLKKLKESPRYATGYGVRRIGYDTDTVYRWGRSRSLSDVFTCNILLSTPTSALTIPDDIEWSRHLPCWYWVLVGLYPHSCCFSRLSFPFTGRLAIRVCVECGWDVAYRLRFTLYVLWAGLDLRGSHKIVQPPYDYQDQ